MIEILKNINDDKWDKFVENDSINGTFLQSRRFLNYHEPEKFNDNSLIWLKGNSIQAVIPAVLFECNGEKILISHPGSTFGGVVIGEGLKKIANIESFFEDFEEYIRNENIKHVVLKQTSSIFCKKESAILDYFLSMLDYDIRYEIGYYVDFSDYKRELLDNLSSSRRRDYKYSLKNNLSFRIITSDSELEEFYSVLQENLAKFDAKPVHSVDELLEFKNSRLVEETLFAGVFYKGVLVAGSMLFDFHKEILHTQYLAVSQKHLDLFVNEFLYVSLIEYARDSGYSKLSFGTCTLEHGKVLNRNLAQYKAGFGSKEYLNVTYEKKYT